MSQRDNVEPVEKEGQEHKHKYFCMADATCRRNKHIVPCKDGDRSNVNTHHRLKHKLCGAASVVEAVKKAAGKGSIEKTFKARKNSGAGTNKCVIKLSFLEKKCGADGEGKISNWPFALPECIAVGYSIDLSLPTALLVTCSV